MAQNNSFTAGRIDAATMGKRALIGWCIGLAVISFFVFGVDHALPEWGAYWRVRPLVVTPLAGAFGGAIFHVLSQLGNSRAARVVMTSFGVLVFIVGLWMGIVLGLVGTMWH